MASHGGHGTEWDTGMAGGLSSLVSRHAGPDGVGLPGIRESWPGRSESLPYHSMPLRIITTAPERMPRLGWRTEDALRNTRNSKVVQLCRAYFFVFHLCTSLIRMLSCLSQQLEFAANGGLVLTSPSNTETIIALHNNTSQPVTQNVTSRRAVRYPLEWKADSRLEQIRRHTKRLPARHQSAHVSLRFVL